MTKFIEKHKLISQYPFGFRRILSSVSALNEITEFVRDTKNKSMNGMKYFSDLKKSWIQLTTASFFLSLKRWFSGENLRFTEK